jgi:hypothetical protein
VNYALAGLTSERIGNVDFEEVGAVVCCCNLIDAAADRGTLVCLFVLGKNRVGGGLDEILNESYWRIHRKLPLKESLSDFDFLWQMLNF